MNLKRGVSNSCRLATVNVDLVVDIARVYVSPACFVGIAVEPLSGTVVAIERIGALDNITLHPELAAIRYEPP